MDKSQDCPSREEFPREKNRWENVLLDVYKIVIWEKPLVSTYSIVCVNLVFWFSLLLSNREFFWLFCCFSLVTGLTFWRSSFGGLQATSAAGILSGMISLLSHYNNVKSYKKLSTLTTEDASSRCFIESVGKQFLFHKSEMPHLKDRYKFVTSVVYLDFKLYGIIFAASLGLTLKQIWNQRKNNLNHRPIERKNVDGDSESSNPGSLRVSSDSSLILEEIRAFSRNVYDGAKNFRQTEPASFCLAGCFFFAMVGFVGNFLSDILTLYILLMVLMIVPGAAIHFLMPRINGNISNFFHSSHEGKINNKNKEEAELFLPEMNQEALEVLNMAAEFQSHDKLEDDELNDPLLECISARTNETTESLSSKLSFYPDSSQMPSPEHSMDFLEFDLTVGGNNQKLEFDSEEINFLTKHFDGNSSDEEEFAQGLKLTGENNDKVNLDGRNMEKSNLNPGALISIGQKLLNTIVQSANVNKNDGESSSDTDSFEMVSEKDI